MHNSVCFASVLCVLVLLIKQLIKGAIYYISYKWNAAYNKTSVYGSVVWVRNLENNGATKLQKWTQNNSKRQWLIKLHKKWCLHHFHEWFFNLFNCSIANIAICTLIACLKKSKAKIKKKNTRKQTYETW